MKDQRVNPSLCSPQCAVPLVDGGSSRRNGGGSVYRRGFGPTNSFFVDRAREEGAPVRDGYNVDQVDVLKAPSSENGRGADRASDGLAGFPSRRRRRAPM